MSKKVVVSCYRDNVEINSNPKLLFSRSLISDISVEDIERLLDTGEGFSMDIFNGNHISFLDFYCLIGQENEVLEKIKAIPESNDPPKANDVNGRYAIVWSLYNEDIRSSKHCTILCMRSRFELGASGMSQKFIDISNNPYIMIIIDYSVTKVCDYIFSKLKRYPVNNTSNKQIVRLSPKKFYRNAAKLLNCDIKDLQITDLCYSSKGKIKITIRTIRNESYSIICTSSCDIISFKSIKKAKT